MIFLKKSACFRILLLYYLLSDDVLANEYNAYIQFNAGAVLPASERITLSDSSADFEFINTYSPGYVTGLAVGYQLTKHGRVEGEWLYQSNDFDIRFAATQLSFDNRAQGERLRAAFLLNAYYDFKNTTPFTPYITAGVGGNHVEFKVDSSVIRNNIDVVYQVGAGVQYSLNDRFSLDIKYRYFSGAEPQFKKVDQRLAGLFDINDHQVIAGIRIDF